MRRLHALHEDRRGSAALEFALSVPVLLLLMQCVAQMGLMYLANAGLKSAVEEGARTASLYAPSPGITDAQIRNRIAAGRFGLDPARITGPTITRGTANGISYIEVSIAYSQPFDLLIFQPAPVTLTATRRAFVP